MIGRGVAESFFPTPFVWLTGRQICRRQAAGLGKQHSTTLVAMTTMQLASPTCSQVAVMRKQPAIPRNSNSSARQTWCTMKPCKRTKFPPKLAAGSNAISSTAMAICRKVRPWLGPAISLHSSNGSCCRPNTTNLSGTCCPTSKTTPRCESCSTAHRKIAPTPDAEEKAACLEMLAATRKHLEELKVAEIPSRARHDLIHALLNHNDFLTIR